MKIFRRKMMMKSGRKKLKTEKTDDDMEGNGDEEDREKTDD